MAPIHGSNHPELDSVTGAFRRFEHNLPASVPAAGFTPPADGSARCAVERHMDPLGSAGVGLFRPQSRRVRRIARWGMPASGNSGPYAT